MFEDLKRIVVVTGHYGCGKTNFAVNLALELAKREPVTVVDLDIVNPYFRTADFGDLFRKNGIDLISPNFANTMLDVPSLPAAIDGAIAGERRVILDVGGDDAGAIVLGRYAKRVEDNGGADVLYLFSRMRPFTRTADDVALHIEQIEQAARLRVSALVHSTNLGAATTAADIEAAADYADETAARTGLPLLATLALASLDIHSLNNVFPVRRYVMAPWESV